MKIVKLVLMTATIVCLRWPLSTSTVLVVGARSSSVDIVGVVQLVLFLHYAV